MSTGGPFHQSDAEVRRKLAAILAADIAGFSRLMELNEEDTARRLAEHRTVMDAIILRYGGRIANTAGDSVLAEFGSSVEAVRCAIDIQEALSTKNHGLPADRWLQFRIGVNVGDVIQKGPDLLGDGINIAARLEALAEPGGICISGEVRDQIDGKLNLSCVSMGKQQLKNIRRPVSAYKVEGQREQGQGLFSSLRDRPNRHLKRYGSGVIAVAVLAAFWFASDLRFIASQMDWLGPMFSETRDKSPGDPTETRRNILKTGTYGGKTYWLVGSWGLSWSEAEVRAREVGGYLVAISSQAENDFIVDLIQDEEFAWRHRDEGSRWQKFGPWIGLVQSEFAEEPDGGWSWSNGEPVTYSNWFVHQPDDYDGVEDFGRYRIFSDQTGIKWDDARSDTTARGYVIEFD
mgnify:CR=1 FL=1